MNLDILLHGCFWILFLYLAFMTLAGHWVFLSTARCVCFQGWQGQAWRRQLLFVIKHLRPPCARFPLSPMSTMLGRIFRSHRHCSVLGGGCHTCCKHRRHPWRNSYLIPASSSCWGQSFPHPGSCSIARTWLMLSFALLRHESLLLYAVGLELPKTN